MKKCIGFLFVMICVIFLDYLAKLLFDSDFSPLRSFLSGICGGICYLFVTRKKTKYL